jgi:uncharacterized Zn-finger protein
MSAIAKESIMEMWDRMTAEKAAKEAAEAPLKKKAAKESKPKTACPHCGKQFISVALHISKTHQVNEIVRLKEGGIAVHINGVRVACWLSQGPNTHQGEMGTLHYNQYEDYLNGYAIRQFDSGPNKGKYQVFYMNKTRGLGCTTNIAFKNYTVRDE